MKVLLVEPDEVAIMKTPPLGLAYVAATIEDDHEVTILPRPTLEMTLDDVEKIFEKEAPDIVGMTSVTMTAQEVIKIAERAKKVLPDVITVIGGIHPTFAYPTMLQYHSDVIDYIVRYEGEYTMLDLLNNLDAPEKVKGLAFVKNGEIITTEERPLITDLDALPFPSRHLLPMHMYKKYSKGNLLSSRGCPFNCLYCSLVKFVGRKFRTVSPERVLEEIIHLVDVYHVDFVDFVDACFTVNKKRVKKICTLLRDQGLDITWRCSARVDSVTPKLLDIMSESGCVSLFYGVESGVERILAKTGKKVSLDQIKNAFKWAQERNIKTTASYIIGLPGDTMETALQTLEFVQSLHADEASPGIFYPFPGTDVYKNPHKYGIEMLYDEAPDFDALLYPAIRTEHLDENQLRELWVQGIFYGKGYDSDHQELPKEENHESHCC